MYGVDLVDLYRGHLSGRKVATFVEQLKPGSRLHISRGGHGAWSAEVAAIHQEGYRTTVAGYAGTGAKQHQIPKPVEPPKEGWQAEQRETQRRQAQKAARWNARRQARLTGAAGK